jgi:membrane associated rhomboid family serine protease
MTSTPVGMRCPDCSRQKTPVRTLRSMHVEPIATYVLIAINVAVFFGVRSSPAAYTDLVLFGPLVGEGEWWRLLTSGFLHTEFWHVGLNMLALFWLGRMIEPALGHARYVGIYMASLFTGSLLVMLMQPLVQTRGASGAVYGLLGAAIVMARNRDIDLMQSGLVPILAFNFGITLIFGFSLAGHVGGLLGGLLVTFVVEELSRRRKGSSLVPAVAFCALVAVGAVVAAIATA